MKILDLTVAALAPQQLPFSLEWLPPPAYFVGGTVRDALLQRQGERFDIDCVVDSGAITTARALADHYQAGFVVLDRDRQIARVVFDEGTVDIAQMVGDHLEADLNRRDFTINAIAYDPHNQTLFDPLHGIEDLQQGLIQMIAKGNLRDDPLRILRAYRQGAQLQFTLQPKTRKALRKLAPLLSTVAGERVRTELNYLLTLPQALPWLTLAAEDQIWQDWLPGFTPDAIPQLAQIEQVAWLLSKIWDEFGAQLAQSSSSHALNALGLAKLASVVTAQGAIAPLNALKYSRAEVRAVERAWQYLPQVLALMEREMSLEEQYFFFQGVGDGLPMVVVLAVAMAAHQDILRETRAVGVVAPLVNAYLDPQSIVAHPTPLVSGTVLIAELNLTPSPQIGELLTQIQLAHIHGQIHTPAEAIAFAKAQL